MAYSALVHTAKASNGTTLITDAIDTSGADLIVIALISYQGATEPTFTDSKSNIWSPMTAYELTADSRCRIHYCRGGTVGAGHTWDVNTIGTFPSIAIAAWSGSVASPADQENGDDFASTTSNQTGSVTPSQDNELVITGVGMGGAATASINGGFTISDQVIYVGGFSFGVGLAYLIQTTATAANPTWSFSGSIPGAMSIATFKAAGGAPVSQVPYRPLWHQLGPVLSG